MAAILEHIEQLGRTGKDATVCAEFICTNEISKYGDRQEMIDAAMALAAEAGKAATAGGSTVAATAQLQRHEAPTNPTRDRWLLAAAAWCAVLVFASFDSGWRYQLSQWSLTLAAIGFAASFWGEGVRHWIIPLVAVAVLFNPLAPISFHRDEWRIVDGVAAGIFLVYIRSFRRSKAAVVGLTIFPLISLGGIKAWSAYEAHCREEWIREEKEARQSKRETLEKYWKATAERELDWAILDWKSFANGTPIKTGYGRTEDETIEVRLVGRYLKLYKGSDIGNYDDHVKVRREAAESRFGGAGLESDRAFFSEMRKEAVARNADYPTR